MHASFPSLLFACERPIMLTRMTFIQYNNTLSLFLVLLPLNRSSSTSTSTSIKANTRTSKLLRRHLYKCHQPILRPMDQVVWYKEVLSRMDRLKDKSRSSSDVSVDIMREDK